MADNTQATVSPVQPAADSDSIASQPLQTQPAAQPPVQQSTGVTAPPPGNVPTQGSPTADQIPPNQIPPEKGFSGAVQKPAHVTLGDKIRETAEALTGGTQHTTSYDENGNPTKHPVHPSPATLGLALAINILGGMGAASGKPASQGFSAGVKEGQEQAAKRQQAQQNQNASDAADYARKYTTAQNNLKLHQLAMTVGQQDEAVNQTYVDSMKPLVNVLENHPDAVLDRVPEEQVQEAMKKYNITKDQFIPYGDPYPILDPKTGEQAKTSSGTPAFGHNYMVVNPNFKAELSDEVKDQGYKLGKFRNPDGSKASIGNPQWPFLDMAKQSVQFAQVQTAEEMLEKHKNDVLGDKAGPRVSLADQVANNPRMMTAVEDFAKYSGTGALDQILGAMANSKDASEHQSAAILMKYLGVEPEDIQKAEAKRMGTNKEVETEAAETPEAKLAKTFAVDLTKASIQEKKAQSAKLWQDVKDANAANTDPSSDRINPDTGVNDGYLDNLTKSNPAMAAQVKAVGRGHMALTYAIMRGMGTKQGPEFLKALNRAYPDFDYTKATTYEKARQAFTSGKEHTNIEALNTALQHVGRMYDHVNAFSSIPGVSNVAELVGNKDAAALASDVAAVSSELAKTYSGAGGFTQGEKEEWQDRLGKHVNPQTLRNNLVEFTQLLKGKLDAMEQTWENGTPAGFVTPIQLMNPNAQAVYERLTGEKFDGYSRQPSAEQQYRGGPAANTIKTVKVKGQQVPVNSDGTVTYNGQSYVISPDGKSLNPAPAKQ